jgi:hypothetical protein
VTGERRDPGRCHQLRFYEHAGRDAERSSQVQLRALNNCASRTNAHPPLVLLEHLREAFTPPVEHDARAFGDVVSSEIPEHLAMLMRGLSADGEQRSGEEPDDAARGDARSTRAAPAPA